MSSYVSSPSSLSGSNASSNSDVFLLVSAIACVSSSSVFGGLGGIGSSSSISWFSSGVSWGSFWGFFLPNSSTGVSSGVGFLFFLTLYAGFLYSVSLFREMALISVVVPSGFVSVCSVTLILSINALYMSFTLFIENGSSFSFLFFFPTCSAP